MYHVVSFHSISNSTINSYVWQGYFSLKIKSAGCYPALRYAILATIVVAAIRILINIRIQKLFSFVIPVKKPFFLSGIFGFILFQTIVYIV